MQDDGKSLKSPPQQKAEQPAKPIATTAVKAAADQNPADSPDLRKILVAKIFGNFYQRLINWVKSLSRRKAVLLLVAFTFAGWAWQNPSTVKDLFILLFYYWEAQQLQYKPKQLESARMLVQYATDEISELHRGSSDRNLDSWPEAQLRISLDRMATVDDAKLIQWFRQQTFGEQCWRKHPTDKIDHIGATSWVLLAFSRMGQSPDKVQVECLLINQHAAGWWPEYPSQDNEANASTYATALSVWALFELSSKKLISPSQRIRAEAEIAAGRDWLLSHSVREQPAHWKDYSDGMYGKESLGISGLVIHVLHVLGSSYPSIDRAWMAHLPDSLPAIDDKVVSGYPVMLVSNGVISDSTYNFAVPWLIVATVDAYSQGSLMQRAKAQRLFSQIDYSEDEIRNKVYGYPGLAAELLMSFRYLQGDKTI